MAYSYGFRDKTIFYKTAFEFGYKCKKEGVLTEMGGNPYEPNSVEQDDFNDGYLKASEEVNNLF